MPRSIRSNAFAVVATEVVAPTAARSGCSSARAGGDKVLPYWASQQSRSIEQNKVILQPELTKFTEQTGVTVNLEVIPFPQLLTKILTATTSGRGPDVVNIGNTWSPSLQATGAFKELSDEKTQTIAVGLQAYASEANVFWNQVMAASLVVSAPIVVGFLPLQRHISDCVAAGAVK